MPPAKDDPIDHAIVHPELAPVSPNNAQGEHPPATWNPGKVRPTAAN